MTTAHRISWTTIHRISRRVRREEAGQALVEFVLVVPVLLLLVLGALDLGKAYNYWIDSTHLSATGARWAAVNKNPGPGATLQESIRSQADSGELRDGGTDAVADPIQVCIAFPEGAEVGKRVEVTVTTNYDFMSYLQANTAITSKSITGTSSMRLEQTPTNISEGCSS
jgi:Flp pilus assembly protein TadG